MTALILPPMTIPTRTKLMRCRYPSISRVTVLPVDIQAFARIARIRLIGSSLAVVLRLPRRRPMLDHPEVRMRYIQYNANI